jgi:hypothetical protein
MSRGSGVLRGCNARASRASRTQVQQLVWKEGPAEADTVQQQVRLALYLPG